MFEAQRTNIPAAGRPDNLFEPIATDGGERGRTWQGRTKETSVTTAAALRPRIAIGMLLLGTAAALGASRYVNGWPAAPRSSRR